MTDKDLIEQRRDYNAGELHRARLQADPLEQFRLWLSAATERGLIDATAMALSTVDRQGQPHCRIVLLKNISAEGFTFYTNYDSDKGSELAGNTRAALLFYWRELERQVRIEGVVSKLPAEDAEQYFNSRPEGSRFSAAASKQSAPVQNRQLLEQSVAALRQQYPDGRVPRPANWGGYLLCPRTLEFWQGRPDRLHDRFRYRQGDNSDWCVERLSP